MNQFDQFSTDIFSTKIFNFKILNIDTNKLKQECFLFKDNDNHDRPQHSNYGGWQSSCIQSNNLDISLYTEMYKLYKIIDDELLTDLSLYYSDNIRLNVLAMWVNINNKNDFNWDHIHSDSIFSGVFYVNVPEDSDSNLQFVRDMREMTSLFHNVYQQDPACKRHSKPDLTNSWNIKPEQNSFVLFPGHLTHRVQPNKSLEERISIVFDVGII